ncbi:hypothetical protein MMC26_005046 [Xylographa opegraphella]|nr:hypothetical protein [Xylographa opegraphella]
MMFRFKKHKNASKASLRGQIVAEPRFAEEIGKSRLEHLVVVRFTIEGGRRKGGSKAGLLYEPRSILLEMIGSDLPTILALRRTSSTMEQFVESKIQKHLQEKFQTLDIVYPLQIQQGPSLMTFGQRLNLIGEYVKKLNVTVMPSRMEANCLQTVKDVESKKSYWHEVSEREFFCKNIAASDYAASFETVLRSLPSLKRIEVILAISDQKDLVNESAVSAGETWYWCPLFDEWPAPQNEAGTPAVTHLLPVMEIRFALDLWRPAKLKVVTLTNLTFAGLLAVSHDALWRMRVTKDATAVDPLAKVKPFWGYMKAVEVNMIAYWELNKQPGEYLVKKHGQAYNLGMVILSRWIEKMDCTKMTWSDLTIATANDVTAEVKLTGFSPTKGPGLFRLFWY